MSFSALIIDDEPLAVEALRRFCARSSKVRIVGEALDGAAGIRLAKELEPDAIFLDIGMPGLSGLDVAAHFGRTDRSPLIVFVTAYDHFATRAYDLSIVDYVLKPLEWSRLERAIERVDRLTGAGRADLPVQEFWVPSSAGMVRLAAASICRVDAERDYVRLRTDQRSYLLRKPITAMEARLDPAVFLRVHRSTILRTDTIKALRHIEGGVWGAVHDDGVTRIGRSYLTRVRERLGL